MTDTIDLRVFHLLCAKLCHDLVSPVGAMSNGVELLGDLGPEDTPEILALITDSSGKANARLKYFRVAYGMATDVARSDADAKGLAVEMFGGHGIEVVWTLDPVIANALAERNAKLLLNMLLLAAECLPRGGVIVVETDRQGASAEYRLQASGEGATVSEGTRAGLAPDTDVGTLSPRTVQGFFTARYAEALGGELRIDEQPGVSVRLSATVNADI